MTKRLIDINADLGEGSEFDAQIMPLISSCSIACGGHFGNEKSIRESIRLAKSHGVKIGAHPSFPDKKNFGRKFLEISPKALIQSLLNQINIFQKIAKEEGIEIHHIKPHGALYNQGANKAEIVKVMVESFLSLSDKPKIYLQNNSILHQEIIGVFPVKLEAFIDRVYIDKSTLLDRSQANSLIQDPKKAWEQLYGIYDAQETTNADGKLIQLKADTFCIHGDQSNAVNILSYIHQQLKEKNICLA